MAYFIVRIVANALAVALTVAILPGIQLAPDIDNRMIRKNILWGCIWKSWRILARS